MIGISEFRKGLKIEIDGEPFIIVDFQHVKPGKGHAFIRTRLKSLLTGSVLDRTFRPSDKVDDPDLEQKEMQYLYKQGEEYCFMDSNTYEQISLTPDHLGETADFLQENCSVQVLFHNRNPIGIEVPTFVNLKVIETRPGVRGDTATGGTKPATLETGRVVQVPLFINEGDVLKVDTRTGDYVERASK